MTYVRTLDVSRELVLYVARLLAGAGCDVLTPVPQRTDGIPPHTDQRTSNQLSS